MQSIIPVNKNMQYILAKLLTFYEDGWQSLKKCIFWKTPISLNDKYKFGEVRTVRARNELDSKEGLWKDLRLLKINTEDCIYKIHTKDERLVVSLFSI